MNSEKNSQQYCKITDQGYKFRSFFALDLPKNIQEEITSIINTLKKQNKYCNLHWSKPENLHLTIRFLGNISFSQYEKIISRVGESIKGFKSFVISLDDLIIFPSPEYPVILALKPEPFLVLLMLNQLIEKGLASCEVQEELRAFRPHLTLGRIRNKIHLEIPTVKLPQLKFTVNNLQLYRSELSKNGSKYTLLKSFDFN